MDHDGASRIETSFARISDIAAVWIGNTNRQKVLAVGIAPIERVAAFVERDQFEDVLLIRQHLCESHHEAITRFSLETDLREHRSADVKGKAVSGTIALRTAPKIRLDMRQNPRSRRKRK